MSQSQDFVRRFHQIFGHVSMAEIARRLRLPHATVRNYFSGRLPSPEVLIKIAETTGVSINWLLTGEGPVYLAEAKGLNIDTLLDIKIEEAINRKIAASGRRREAAATVRNRSFDIKAALEKYRDPNRIMSEWFKFEGRKYPQDFGVVFFSGWESFSCDEKLDAIRDAKKVLDRNLLRDEA